MLKIEGNEGGGEGIQEFEGLPVSYTLFKYTHSTGKQSEAEIRYYQKIAKLSPREKEVLELIMLPSMNFYKMARKLKISRDEVKTYWGRIRRKLDGTV